MSPVVDLPSCGCASGGGGPKHEIPGGARNGLNTHYTTSQSFAPGSLEIFLDGVRLGADNFTEGADHKSFSLVIDPVSRNALHNPPHDDETLEVAYSLGACVTTI